MRNYISQNFSQNRMYGRDHYRKYIINQLVCMLLEIWVKRIGCYSISIPFRQENFSENVFGLMDGDMLSKLKDIKEF